MRKNIAVIGGGAGGMMAAIQAASLGNLVYLYEKKHRLGSKLLISGGGRCNITNTAEMREFISNFGENGKFLYNTFHRFFNRELMEFFEGLGVQLKVERGGRVFPESDKSIEIVNALTTKLEELRVQIHLNSPIKKLSARDGKIVAIQSDKETMLFHKIIVATGGMSYPRTGSTGDGYSFAKNLGIKVNPIYPALVPLVVIEDVSPLEGLKLKNVKASFWQKGECISEEFGEMEFTNYGVTGAIILGQSKKIVQALTKGKVHLEIDLKSALDDEKLDNRLIRDLNKSGKKYYKNFLKGLLPRDLIDYFIKLSEIPPTKPCHQISSEERGKIFNLLRKFSLTIVDSRPIEEALVTVGGIDLLEIDPKTMESNKIQGLYFCGEVLDIDGDTGGFNLQAAFSTGYVAGLNCGK